MSYYPQPYFKTTPQTQEFKVYDLAKLVNLTPDKVRDFRRDKYFIAAANILESYKTCITNDIRHKKYISSLSLEQLYNHNQTGKLAFGLNLINLWNNFEYFQGILRETMLSTTRSSNVSKNLASYFTTLQLLKELEIVNGKSQSKLQCCSDPYTSTVSYGNAMILTNGKSKEFKIEPDFLLNYITAPIQLISMMRRVDEPIQEEYVEQIYGIRKTDPYYKDKVQPLLSSVVSLIDQQNS